MEIYDREQIRRFLDVFPELKDDEVLFVSLSSRSKYLTKEQKDQGLVINRNEMFHRRWLSGNKKQLLFDLEKYLKEVRCASDVANDLETEDYLLDFTTSSGHPIPLNTVSVYVNINPSSMKKAAANLCSDVMKKLVESDDEWFLRLQSKLNTEVQKAKSRRELIDIDLDVPHIDAATWIKTRIGGKIIQTHSGYHLLVQKEDISRNKINLGGVISEANQRFLNDEIIINSNAMIPLPGTFQGGKPVKFVD